MAKLKKAVVGKISGALGDLVFRIRNGKNFISTRPSGSKVKDAAAIERQQRFAIAGRLARSVTSVDMLKYFWGKSAPKSLSANNFIVKLNYPFVTANNINDNILLMPSLGFSVNLDVMNIQPDRVSVDFNAIGNATGIDPVVEVNVVCGGILFLNDPVHSNEGPYTFFSLQTGSFPLTLNDPMSFEMIYNDIQKQQYGTFINAKGFFTLVSFDSENNPVRFSNTVFGVKS